MRSNLFIVVFFIFSLAAKAQNEEINTAGFTFLDYKFELPHDLLSTKTVVFVSMSSKDKKIIKRSTWKDFAEKAHQEFRKMGIDAIGYYHIDDIKSARDATITFAKGMKKRGVKNIILLSQVETKKSSENSEQFVIVITPFNDENSFIDQGQKAWKVQNSDFKEAFKIMGKEVYKSEQPKTNFLITDLPEFFTDTKMIYGRRFGVNCRDLKVDKLAIAKFQKIEIPEKKPGGVINANIEKEISLYNDQVDAKNKELEKIMKSYPFKYEIVDATTDDDFYRLGFQYVLLGMNTSGLTIRELLDYEVDYTETDYITIKATEYGTTLRSLPVNAKVHKFYVRHLYTKDVYTGARWDADETWQDALKNFIRNMKDEFKID